MDKLFEEMFSKQPDEIVNGDYFYHSHWYEEESAAIACMGTTLDELRVEREDNWLKRDGIKRMWDYKSFQTIFAPPYKPFWMIPDSENNDLLKPTEVFNKIVNKIALNNKPFMEISCSTSMGLAPFIVKINQKIPCILTDIDQHIIKCLRLSANKNLAECNLNFACFDNYHIPIKDNSLDYITSFYGISDIATKNIRNNYAAFTVGKEKPINEVYRILKPGGCFITFERGYEWRFNLSKTREILGRGGNLFETYSFNEIEEIHNRLQSLKPPSWHEQFVAAGFQVETEDNYLQKSTGNEIRTEFVHLTGIFEIRQWTAAEFNKYTSAAESMNPQALDKEAENCGIEFSSGDIFYILRKPFD